jgi:hypothetical protein
MSGRLPSGCTNTAKRYRWPFIKKEQCACLPVMNTSSIEWQKILEDAAQQALPLSKI